jgi:hypothetical protein
MPMLRALVSLLQKLIKVDPKIKFGDDGLDFDLGLKIDLPEFQVRPRE